MANTSWEPTYGFCASNETDNVALAKSLEAIRRRVCAYGGGDYCDCKYGLTVEENLAHQSFGLSDPDRGVRGTRWDNKTHTHVLTHATMGSEQTGCPELREMIHRLLHRDAPLF